MTSLRKYSNSERFVTYSTIPANNSKTRNGLKNILYTARNVNLNHTYNVHV